MVRFFSKLLGSRNLFCEALVPGWCTKLREGMLFEATPWNPEFLQ